LLGSFVRCLGQGREGPAHVRSDAGFGGQALNESLEERLEMCGIASGIADLMNKNGIKSGSNIAFAEEDCDDIRDKLKSSFQG